MRSWIVLFTGYIMITGCANIAENGALLNTHVSEGIQQYQQEIEKLIKTLADIERNILDEKWEEIYSRSEDEYRSNTNIDQETSLTKDQRIDICTIAASLRDSILTDIMKIESVLISETRHNATLLIEINDCITEYLLSLQELDKAQKDIADRLESLIGINVGSLIGTVTSTVESLP